MMILDARDPQVSLDRSSPVAIVGAGPAGMMLARELAKSGPVLLLEGGGLMFDPVGLGLYDGDNVGIPYPLTTTRARQFGGSTALWNGYCAQFDAQDFMRRDWVPHSGWPFGAEELQPYYARTAALLNLGDVNFDARDIARRSGSALPLDNDRVEPTVWRFGTPIVRFADRFREEFESSREITTMLHANVVDIRLNRDHSAVTELQVRTLEGCQGIVAADRFVLACGGLETPRILLNANTQVSPGIGNVNGLVGRFFMEHPHLSIPGLNPSDERFCRSWTQHGIYDDAKEYMSCVGLSSQERANRKILNARVHVYRSPAMADGEAPRVGIFLEQAPNADSRVSLCGETDALGMRRLRLDWRVNELDWTSFESTAAVIRAEFEAVDIGSSQVSCASVVRDPSSLLYTNHHLGTTRMSNRAVDGVVDGNGRVHDLENLYIVGGSTFPTGSWANPTFTVVSLALRLADHLSSLPSR
jgi:choline dehydrogenase-like flavoprotein